MFGNFGAMPKTMDYDYVVEEFMAEVKLNKKKLKEVIEAYKLNPSVYLRRKFDKYWPENTVEDIATCKVEDIPNTVFKRTYYRQSEKDENTIPIKHYSLQEIILTRLQQDRNANKKLMAEAKARHDVDNEKRFNALQLALKVISNSFYGASDNKVFAHYDSNVAGSITWAARNCIGQLTSGIECEDLYIDKKMYEDEYMQERIEKLKNIGALTVEKIKDEEYDQIQRRNGLRRLFNDVYEIKRDIEIYKIHKAPGVLVYQDTDSNYFIVPKIINYYLGDPMDPKSFHASPELLRKLMLSSVDMNELLGQIIVKIIDRKPVGLGFEGSFVICRYLNRKKKYYGVKAADDDGNVFTDKLIVFEIDEDGHKVEHLLEGAYNEDGTLTYDFDKLWKPKEKLVPQTNGHFINIDDDKLLKERGNYLDNIQSYGVKVTGVDLTRRDKYKFINYYHTKVLQRDLMICKYDYTKKEWVGIPLNEPLTDLIFGFIDEFKDCMRQFQLIADFKTDELPKPCFRLDDFSKNNRNDPTSGNATRAIIQRYQQTIDKLKKATDIDEETRNMMITRYTNYIPYIGDRLFYVICTSEAAENNIHKGLKKMPANKDLSKSIEELADIIEDECGGNSRAYFEKRVGNLNLEYEEWLNAKKISKLYMKHYLQALGKSMSLYLLGEMFPTEARAMNNGEVDDVDDLVTKLTNKIGAAVVNRYYPGSREVKASTRIQKVDVKKLSASNAIGLFNELFPKTAFEEAKVAFYKSNIKNLIERTEKQRQVAMELKQLLMYDRFSVPQHMTKAQAAAYQKFNTYERISDEYDKYQTRLTKLQVLLKLLK